MTDEIWRQMKELKESLTGDEQWGFKTYLDDVVPEGWYIIVLTKWYHYVWLWLYTLRYGRHSVKKL